MKTTKDYLGDLARRYPRADGRPASDYGLAKLLGVSTPTLSKYRNRGGTFDDAVALRVAELLDLEPVKVLAAMQAERARSPAVRAVWARYIMSNLIKTFLRAPLLAHAPLRRSVWGNPRHLAGSLGLG